MPVASSAITLAASVFRLVCSTHREHLLELRAAARERLLLLQPQFERRHLFLQTLIFFVGAAEREVAVPHVADAAEQARGADLDLREDAERRRPGSTFVPADVCTCAEIRMICPSTTARNRYPVRRWMSSITRGWGAVRRVGRRIVSMISLSRFSAAG